MDESRWPRRNETEICLLTYDGAQHLKLHGWLKRHKVPIRAENIINEEDCFGIFTVIISDDSFYELLVEDVMELLKVWNMLSQNLEDTVKFENKEKTKYQILKSRLDMK